MAVQLVTKINRYIGTAAEIAAMTLTGIPAGSTFFESDTGILKILNAAGALVEAPSESVQLSGSNVTVNTTITLEANVESTTVFTSAKTVIVKNNGTGTVRVAFDETADNTKFLLNENQSISGIKVTELHLLSTGTPSVSVLGG